MPKNDLNWMVYAQRRSSSKEQLWKGTPVPITVLRDVVLKFLSAKQGLTQRDLAPWDKSEVCLRYIQCTRLSYTIGQIKSI